jgi:hypothetical protein
MLKKIFKYLKFAKQGQEPNCTIIATINSMVMHDRDQLWKLVDNNTIKFYRRWPFAFIFPLYKRVEYHSKITHKNIVSAFIYCHRKAYGKAPYYVPNVLYRLYGKTPAYNRLSEDSSYEDCIKADSVQVLTTKAEVPKGLVSNHAYALNTKFTNEIIRLMNPWLYFEPGNDGNNDGVFNITWKDVKRNFRAVYRARKLRSLFG